MAVFKPGALVGAISGQVGSQTFVNAGRGTRIQARGKPCVRQSVAQMAQRAKFEACRLGWSALTEAQRGLWRARAAQEVRQNAVGVARVMTGFELFMLVNLGNFSYTGTMITTVPTTIFRPAPRITNVWVKTSAPAAFNISFSTVGQSFPMNCFIWVGLAGQNRGRIRVRSPKFIGAVACSSIQNIQTLVSTAFGRVPQANESVSIEVENHHGGYSSPRTVLKLLGGESVNFPM